MRSGDCQGASLPGHPCAGASLFRSREGKSVMTCDEAKLGLANHWTQSLSSAEKIELEGPLGSCEPCRREAERLETLWRNLGAVRPFDEGNAEPDSSMRVRFYETLAAYRDGASGNSGRGSSVWKLAGQIAAGIVLLLGGVGLG